MGGPGSGKPSKEMQIVRRIEPKVTPIASGGDTGYIIPNLSGLGRNQDATNYLGSKYLKLDCSNDPLTDTLTAKSILPDTTLTYSLGSSSSYWNNVFTSGITVSSLLTMGATAKVLNDFVPFTDNNYDLGSSLKRWANLLIMNGYFYSNIYLDTNTGKFYLGDNQETSFYYNGTNLNTDLDTGEFLINQGADDKGVKVKGYDNVSNDYIHMSVLANGNGSIWTTQDFQWTVDNGYTLMQGRSNALYIYQPILPSSDNLKNIGSTTLRWKDCYIVNTHHYADNGKCYFGAGDDCSIYYDGTDMIINSDDVGSGGCKINALNIRADGTIQPISMADASAANDSIYYSTTQSKLVYKDSGGTVNNLY